MKYRVFSEPLCLYSQASLLCKLSSTPPEQWSYQSRDRIPCNGSCTACRTKFTVLHVAFETPLHTWLQPVCPAIPRVLRGERRWGPSKKRRTGMVGLKACQPVKGGSTLWSRDEEMMPTAEQQERWVDLVSVGSLQPQEGMTRRWWSILKLNTPCWRKSHWILSWEEFCLDFLSPLRCSVTRIPRKGPARFCG